MAKGIAQGMVSMFLIKSVIETDLNNENWAGYIYRVYFLYIIAQKNYWLLNNSGPVSQ